MERISALSAWSDVQLRVALQEARRFMHEASQGMEAAQSSGAYWGRAVVYTTYQLRAGKLQEELGRRGTLPGSVI